MDKENRNGNRSPQESFQGTDIPNQQPSLVYAGIWKRSAALIIDLAVAAVFLSIFSKIFPGTCIEDTYNIRICVGSIEVCGLVAWFFSLLNFLYYVIPEWKLGGTLGKLVMGIRVRNLEGEQISIKASLTRNILRIVDFLPAFYTGGIFLIWRSKRNQRFGDRIAKTVVIEK